MKTCGIFDEEAFELTEEVRGDWEVKDLFMALFLQILDDHMLLF